MKTEQPEIWSWYATAKARGEQADATRFELLKTTYRVEPETQPELYAAAHEAAAMLGLDLPITIYQAQNPVGLNASLAFVPHEAHLVLHGPIQSKLKEGELRALLAHELSHLLLWQCCDGEFLIADQLLAALTHDARADVPHFATARLFRLYNEILCDRGSLVAVNDALVVISMLLKIHTELEEVSPEGYLRQADEIFSHGPVRADELTHPEAFIRARALKLWSDEDSQSEAKLREMIEGTPKLHELDLLAQTRVAGLTRRLVDVFLAPQWIQTEATLGHARLFFDNYTPPRGVVKDAALQEDIRTDDPALKDYYCYVLLDFVTTDRDLEEMPLASALEFTEQLGIKDRFTEIAQRELRLRKKQLERIDQEKRDLLARAENDPPSP